MASNRSGSPEDIAEIEIDFQSIGSSTSNESNNDEEDGGPANQPDACERPAGQLEVAESDEIDRFLASQPHRIDKLEEFDRNLEEYQRCGVRDPIPDEVLNSSYGDLTDISLFEPTSDQIVYKLKPMTLVHGHPDRVKKTFKECYQNLPYRDDSIREMNRPRTAEEKRQLNMQKFEKKFPDKRKFFASAEGVLPDNPAQRANSKRQSLPEEFNAICMHADRIRKAKDAQPEVEEDPNLEESNDHAGPYSTPDSDLLREIFGVGLPAENQPQLSQVNAPTLQAGSPLARNKSNYSPESQEELEGEQQPQVTTTSRKIKGVRKRKQMNEQGDPQVISGSQNVQPRSLPTESPHHHTIRKAKDALPEAEEEPNSEEYTLDSDLIREIFGVGLPAENQPQLCHVNAPTLQAGSPLARNKSNYSPESQEELEGEQQPQVTTTSRKIKGVRKRKQTNEQGDPQVISGSQNVQPRSLPTESPHHHTIRKAKDALPEAEEEPNSEEYTLDSDLIREIFGVGLPAKNQPQLYQVNAPTLQAGSPLARNKSNYSSESQEELEGEQQPQVTTTSRKIKGVRKRKQTNEQGDPQVISGSQNVQPRSLPTESPHHHTIRKAKDALPEAEEEPNLEESYDPAGPYSTLDSDIIRELFDVGSPAEYQPQLCQVNAPTLQAGWPLARNKSNYSSESQEELEGERQSQATTTRTKIKGVGKRKQMNEQADPQVISGSQNVQPRCLPIESPHHPERSAGRRRRRSRSREMEIPKIVINSPPNSPQSPQPVPIRNISHPQINPPLNPEPEFVNDAERATIGSPPRPNRSSLRRDGSGFRSPGSQNPRSQSQIRPPLQARSLSSRGSGHQTFRISNPSLRQDQTRPVATPPQKQRGQISAGSRREPPRQGRIAGKVCPRSIPNYIPGANIVHPCPISMVCSDQDRPCMPSSNDNDASEYSFNAPIHSTAIEIELPFEQNQASGAAAPVPQCNQEQANNSQSKAPNASSVSRSKHSSRHTNDSQNRDPNVQSPVPCLRPRQIVESMYREEQGSRSPNEQSSVQRSIPNKTASPVSRSKHSSRHTSDSQNRDPNVQSPVPCLVPRQTVDSIYTEEQGSRSPNEQSSVQRSIPNKTASPVSRSKHSSRHTSDSQNRDPNVQGPVLVLRPSQIVGPANTAEQGSRSPNEQCSVQRSIPNKTASPLSRSKHSSRHTSDSQNRDPNVRGPVLVLRPSQIVGPANTAEQGSRSPNEQCSVQRSIPNKTASPLSRSKHSSRHTSDSQNRDPNVRGPVLVLRPSPILGPANTAEQGSRSPNEQCSVQRSIPNKTASPVSRSKHSSRHTSDSQNRDPNVRGPVLVLRPSPILGPANTAEQGSRSPNEQCSVQRSIPNKTASPVSRSKHSSRHTSDSQNRDPNVRGPVLVLRPSPIVGPANTAEQGSRSPNEQCSVQRSIPNKTASPVSRSKHSSRHTSDSQNRDPNVRGPVLVLRPSQIVGPVNTVSRSKHSSRHTSDSQNRDPNVQGPVLVLRPSQIAGPVNTAEQGSRSPNEQSSVQRSIPNKTASPVSRSKRSSRNTSDSQNRDPNVQSPVPCLVPSQIVGSVNTGEQRSRSPSAQSSIQRSIPNNTASSVSRSRRSSRHRNDSQNRDPNIERPVPCLVPSQIVGSVNTGEQGSQCSMPSQIEGSISIGDERDRFRNVTLSRGTNISNNLQCSIPNPTRSRYEQNSTMLVTTPNQRIESRSPPRRSVQPAHDTQRRPPNEQNRAINDAFIIPRIIVSAPDPEIQIGDISDEIPLAGPAGMENPRNFLQVPFINCYDDRQCHIPAQPPSPPSSDSGSEGQRSRGPPRNRGRPRRPPNGPPSPPDSFSGCPRRQRRQPKRPPTKPKLPPRPWMETEKPKKKKDFTLTDEQRALVLDNYYPGLIHDAVNQRADFNEIAKKFVTPETAVDGNKAEKGMSLLEAFDTRVKYEQITLKSILTIAPPPSSKGKKPALDYEPVYGPLAHPVVSDIILEDNVRASAIPVDLQHYIRTTPESDPVRAISCLSRAQRLNDYYKEYRAAAAAANLAPPDKIEQAALHGVKTFQIDSLSSETTTVHSEFYKALELVSYIGVTKSN